MRHFEHAPGFSRVRAATEAIMRYLRLGVSLLISYIVLAGASAQLPANGLGTFVLSVDRQGSYFSAGDRTPLDDAAVVAQAAAALSRGADFVVEAEEDAPYQSVVRAAALLQQSGATKISFRTR
jgi:biopolymer transport protein ExbD